MKLSLSENFCNLVKSCPFPVYAVGGYVRDSLAGLSAAHSDIDVCAPVSSETFLKTAEKLGLHINAQYRNTGTFKINFDGAEYEFACFRSDEYVRGAHNPVKTFFTDDIYLDARRRDFKCNAVYYDIKSDEFVDPLGGIEDIKKNRISTVADADKVFGEDGLRLMRLARQAAQTGFTPEKECLDGARANAALIRDISAERIYAELDAILHADERYGIKYAQYVGLEILDDIGVLDYILPELTLGRGMKQNELYHKYDVLKHSLLAVKYADKSVRLAALLHDAGKPYCMKNNGNFYGHEHESARISKEICKRLKVSKAATEETVRLCALHMYDMRCDARENKIRKLIVRNLDIFDKLLYIKQADYSACRGDLGEAPCVTKWEEIYAKMKSENAPLTVKQLNIKGNELIAAGIAPSEVGGILKTLLEDCVCMTTLNKKKQLLKHALRLARQPNNDNAKG